MNEYLTYKSIPIGSLVDRPIEEEQEYLQLITELPGPLLDLIMSPKTGAYVRGLVKAYDISESLAPAVAFIFLKTVFGELPLSKLGAVLSSDLGIANDRAQKMAQEVEHDLFSAVSVEMNNYLETKKLEIKKLENKATGNPEAAGAPNVLDLKNKPKPAAPPPIPRRFSNE